MNNYIANVLKTLIVPTAKTTDGMAVNFFQSILLLKVDRFIGFLNQCKIDRMVNDNLSSCNSK